jgi:predicted MFS family arabinose efflux permease
MLSGLTMAFVQQYRFAAAESVPSRLAARAVAVVLVGGIVAGILGPELARRAADWIAPAPYSGSFLGLAALNVAASALLLLYRDGPQATVAPGLEIAAQGRPLRQIVSQPVYLLAVLAGGVAYGGMNLITTAIPVHLHTGHGYSLQQTALMVQSHVVAMFLPSFFTALLLERLGLLRVMLAGIACMAAAATLGVVGGRLADYWLALVLLGLGWNLLFVGATVLLTRSYSPAERFGAQAVNDLLVFGSQGLASLMAGPLLFYTDWRTLNLLGFPFLAATLASLLLLRRLLADAPGLRAA